MERRTAWPALASLDRRFGASFRGDQLASLFPGEGAKDLIRRRVLVDDGFAWTIGHCICDLNHDDCIVRVDLADGVYQGYCNEYGRPMEVSPDVLQRYRFDWKAWAGWLRIRNALDGAGPALGAGALFVGSGTMGGREFGLVVIAPGCRRNEDVVLPEEARSPGRTLVGLILGDPVEALPIDALIPASALSTDFGTIDAAAIEHVLEGAPITITRGEAVCVLYSREAPRGRPIDDAEYQRLHGPEMRGQFDLFVDRIKGKVWRRGKACVSVLDAAGRAKGKKLGPKAISLLADYMRNPGAPMLAKQTRTYGGSTTTERSASVLFGEVRRSIRGHDFLRAGARADRVGETPYYFEPGNMTWCLLEPLTTH